MPMECLIAGIVVGSCWALTMCGGCMTERVIPIHERARVVPLPVIIPPDIIMMDWDPKTMVIVATPSGTYELGMMIKS
jgi:hypothetical protein